MLLTNDILDRIWAGEVTVVFRRWQRPTVKTGGTLCTRRGMLDIVSVDTVAVSTITVDETTRAGYETKAALLRALRTRKGTTYRIEVRPGGIDPLVALRNDDSLDDDALADVRTRLARLDANSDAPWTKQYLELIASQPFVRAEDLAASIGLTKPPFKSNVRKLKGLGLTISHSLGYELSPRGEAVLKHL